jgi:hypothetical protein
MTAAVFGLVGVIIGGLITTWAAYFMERRKAWVAARSAGLQLYAQLSGALELEPARCAERTLLVATAAWPEHREALLFRTGVFPSGLTSAEWLSLARSMAQIERLSLAGDEAGVTQAADAARTQLAIFLPDRPAPMGSFLNLMRRVNPFARIH